jgi:GR25 family glycosyltransferase involved in LPS biosynthesis
MNKTLFHIVFIFFSILLLVIGNMFIDQRSKVPFEKIYLINLHRRPDRLEAFMTTYKQSDMKRFPIIKLSAIDGSTLNMNTIPMTELAQLEMKQLETTGFRHKHYQLTKGAIGCYLSHLKIWEDIYLKGYENALIFEDDARPPPNFLHLMKTSYSNFPPDWDIILYGVRCHDCEHHKHYLKVKRFILLHTYMIRPKAIAKILSFKSLFPISQQLDAYLSEMSTELNIYASPTNYVNQSQSRTDIQAPILNNPKVNDRMVIESK